MQSTRVQQLIEDLNATMEGLDVSLEVAGTSGIMAARRLTEKLVKELQNAHGTVELLAGILISDYIQAVEDDDISDFSSWVHTSEAWIANCSNATECLKSIGIDDTEAFIEMKRREIRDGNADYDDDEGDNDE